MLGVSMRRGYLGIVRSITHCRIIVSFIAILILAGLATVCVACVVALIFLVILNAKNDKRLHLSYLGDTLKNLELSSENNVD